MYIHVAPHANGFNVKPMLYAVAVGVVPVLCLTATMNTVMFLCWFHATRQNCIVNRASCLNLVIVAPLSVAVVFVTHFGAVVLTFPFTYAHNAARGFLVMTTAVNVESCIRLEFDAFGALFQAVNARLWRDIWQQRRLVNHHET